MTRVASVLPHIVWGDPSESDQVQTCIWCGRSVKPGSGNFVNRVPVCVESDDEVGEMGAPNPRGRYICQECDVCEEWLDKDCAHCDLRGEQG